MMAHHLFLTFLLIVKISINFLLFVDFFVVSVSIKTNTGNPYFWYIQSYPSWYTSIYTSDYIQYFQFIGKVYAFCECYLEA